MENRPDLPGLLHLGAPASGGTPEIGPELAELLNKFQKRDIESQLDVVRLVNMVTLSRDLERLKLEQHRKERESANKDEDAKADEPRTTTAQPRPGPSRAESLPTRRIYDAVITGSTCFNYEKPEPGVAVHIELRIFDPSGKWPDTTEGLNRGDKFELHRIMKYPMGFEERTS